MERRNSLLAGIRHHRSLDAAVLLSPVSTPKILQMGKHLGAKVSGRALTLGFQLCTQGQSMQETPLGQEI